MTLTILDRAKVRILDGEINGGMNDLNGLSCYLLIRSAPDFMPPHDLLNTARHNLPIATPNSMDGDRFVMKRSNLTGKLVDPPNLLLCWRRRDRIVSNLRLERG